MHNSFALGTLSRFIAEHSESETLFEPFEFIFPIIQCTPLAQDVSAAVYVVQEEAEDQQLHMVEI